MEMGWPGGKVDDVLMGAGLEAHSQLRTTQHTHTTYSRILDSETTPIHTTYNTVVSLHDVNFYISVFNKCINTISHCAVLT